MQRVSQLYRIERKEACESSLKNNICLDKFHTFSEKSYNGLWENVLMLMDARISVIALTLPSSNEEKVVSWMDKKREAGKLVSHKSEDIFFAMGLHSSLFLIQRAHN